MTLPLRGLVTAVCLFMLAACGGGGGGGSGGGAGLPGGGGSGGGGNSPPTGAPGYVGSTTAADLTSSSVVPPLSGWLLLELGLTEGLNSGSIASAKPSQSSMQKRFGKARERAVALASRMTIQAVTTEPCGLSGTTEINDDGLRTDGTGVVVFTFRDCAEGDGTTLNGVLRVTIAAIDPIYFEPTDYTVNFENVRITSGADSIEAGGSVHVVVTDTAVTTTRNTVARYLPENVYLRLQDFVATEGSDEHGYGLTYHGRFYQSQYGYVDVDAPFPLSYEPTWGTVLAGSMLLTANPGPGMVELRFREWGLLSVVVDVNNDAVPERGLSARPSDLFRPNSDWAPMADAGPDPNYQEGDLVTFDASDNRDWEGGPVTMAWSINHAPVGAGPIAAGSGTAYSFTATVPGYYTVDLIVTDSTGRMASDQVVVQVYDIPGPYANAGPDRTTVERSTITLDGSRTIPASGSVDSLQFAWTLVAAPPNSSAPATLSGMSPQVTVDLLGQYTYRLTVSGRGGTSSDTVTIVAAPLLTATTTTFYIGPATSAASTTFQMPIQRTPGYTGSQLSATISSDADWLTIDTANITTATTSVTVRLDLDALASLPVGSHRGTVRIQASGYSEWSGQFTLQLDLASVRQASPYVVYTGQATTVNLLGEQLNQAADRLFLNGTRLTELTRVSASKARTELPSLTPGEYSVNVTNALGIQRPAARVVVRDPPAHPDGEVILPGVPIAIEYDPERDVFYGVFVTNAGTYLARRFYRQADGEWQFDPIVVTEPRALTLGLGGERLFVSTGSCGVHEVDAVTLQTLVPATMRGCMTNGRGVIAALADGEVVIANTNQWSDLWRYPSFTPVATASSVYGAIGVVSHDRSRMLWAQEASITPPHPLYVLDVLGGPVDATSSWSTVAVHDGGTYLTTSNLAISGDGSRFMHREDVYNNNYQHVGSLQGLSHRDLTPAVSRRGTRAVVYDSLADQMKLFDVSGDNSFPLVRVIGTFAAEVDSLRLAYYPDDAAVFMWGRVRTGTSGGLPT